MGPFTACCKKTLKEHKRIIFNGDGYAAAWQEEAANRGLLNLKSTPDALAYLTDEKKCKIIPEASYFYRNRGPFPL